MRRRRTKCSPAGAMPARHDGAASMRLTRRALLGGGMAAAGLAATHVAPPGWGLSPPPAAAEQDAAFDPHDWDSVRDQFELSREYLQFSAFMVSPHPRIVREAIALHRHRINTDPHQFGTGFADILNSEVTRQAVADSIACSPEDVALTDSTTMGIGLIYFGLRLRPHQEILTTEHEFYGTHEALRLRADFDGTRVRRVRLWDDPASTSVDEIVGRLVAAIRPTTRAVAMTWVESNTGVKAPVRAIADALADLNAGRHEDNRVLLCVDGVHGFGIEDVTMPDLGCDFFISGTHKWLWGPRGTGIVYGKPEAWEYVQPIIPSFSVAALRAWADGHLPDGPPGDLNTPGGYHSFELRWALPQAFEFREAIGAGRVQERTHSQATQLKEGLAALPRVRVATPMDPALSSGAVCCSVEGVDPLDAVPVLRQQHGVLASSTEYPIYHLRFGPSIVTTPEEVDQVVQAVAQLA